jgi:uncharacterized membrane protein YhaH (DUF805 family)
MSDLFSMDGRYNRAKFFWAVFGIFVVVIVLSIVLGLVTGSSGGDANTAQGLGLFISIPAMIIIAFQIVKRLHDLGRPGSHYWLLFIPFYNIYLGLVILLKKGDEGRNEYGPDPLAGR